MKRTFALPTLALSVAFAALAGCGGSPSTVKPAFTASTAQSGTPSTTGSRPGAGTTPASSTAASTSATPPTYSQIQTQPGWKWCSAMMNGHVCAGGRGQATSSLTPHQSNPALSGDSAVFTLGGNKPYSNAIWWRTLSNDTKSTHFTYDLNFYIDNPGAPESLEFDVNQAIGKNRYTWGTQCNFKGDGKWDIWNDATQHWEPTSVACPEVSANAWHHLTWQFERVGSQVHYISVTLDGNTSTVDAFRNFQAGFGGNGIDVAFQLDGNFQQSPFKVWLDQVSLTTS